MIKVLFIVFVLLIVIGVIYPLRHSKRGVVIVGLGVCLVLAVGELQFGNGWLWLQAYHQQTQLDQAKVVLKSFKNKDEVIQALKARLDDTPKSARGWALLGRLYSSESKWLDARAAFEKASHLAPQKVDYAVQWAVSAWQVDKQQMSSETRALFQRIILKHPNQPDALMFLALDASLHHNKQLTIQYWTRLLALVPPDSEDAKRIREAIEKAKED